VYRNQVRRGRVTNIIGHQHLAAAVKTIVQAGRHRGQPVSGIGGHQRSRAWMGVHEVDRVEADGHTRSDGDRGCELGEDRTAGGVLVVAEEEGGPAALACGARVNRDGEFGKFGWTGVGQTGLDPILDTVNDRGGRLFRPLEIKQALEPVVVVEPRTQFLVVDDELFHVFRELFDRQVPVVQLDLFAVHACLFLM